MSDRQPSKPFVRDIFLCVSSAEVERMASLPQLAHLPLKQQVVSCFLAGLRGYEQNIAIFAVFPRETKPDASGANATESSGHGIGEHDAQAPCGPRPNQETEPSGGAGISPGTLELILLIVLLMIVALGIFQLLRYFFF